MTLKQDSPATPCGEPTPTVPYEVASLDALFAPRSLAVVGASDDPNASVGLGYPVALKVVSPDLPYKSDVGGVRLGISDATTLALAHRSLLSDVRAAGPGADVRGVLVQRMGRSVARPTRSRRGSTSTPSW